jgi:hypothetical protein
MKTLNLIAQTIRQDKRSHIERITDYLSGLATKDIKIVVNNFNSRTNYRKLNIEENP